MRERENKREREKERERKKERKKEKRESWGEGQQWGEGSRDRQFQKWYTTKPPQQSHIPSGSFQKLYKTKKERKLGAGQAQKK